MDRIRLIKENPTWALAVTAMISIIQFGAHIVVALDDGQIDSVELHSLMSTADGFQAILLAVVMSALKKKGKK